jgi:hypothetical protein
MVRFRTVALWRLTDVGGAQSGRATEVRDNCWRRCQDLSCRAAQHCLGHADPTVIVWEFDTLVAVFLGIEIDIRVFPRHKIVAGAPKNVM